MLFPFVELLRRKQNILVLWQIMSIIREKKGHKTIIFRLDFQNAYERVNQRPLKIVLESGDKRIWGSLGKWEFSFCHLSFQFLINGKPGTWFRVLLAVLHCERITGVAWGRGQPEWGSFRQNNGVIQQVRVGLALGKRGLCVGLWQNGV